MHSIRNILSLSLLLTLSSSLVHPHRVHQESQDQVEDSGLAGLQKLLDQVDAPSLHAALHDLSPKKFKHGMFQDDRTAVEAIHKDEPSLATSVVYVAKRNVMDDIKQDLAKRQDISNGTTPSTTPAAVVPGVSSTPLVTPVPQGGDTSTTAPSPSADATATPAAGGESTPSTPTSTSTSSNGAIAAGSDSGSTPSTSTSAGGSPGATSPSATSTSSAPLTRGQVVTSTNSVGLVIVSTVGGGVRTITPSGAGSLTSGSRTQTSMTSTVVHTSTLPNGSQSVVTAVTVVGADGAAADTPTGTAGVTESGTSSGSPGLQTGEAPMTRGWCKEMVLVVGGAVGVAMMM